MLEDKKEETNIANEKYFSIFATGLNVNELLLIVFEEGINEVNESVLYMKSINMKYKSTSKTGK